MILHATQLPKYNIPDSKVHGANMGPTWVLSAPGGTHVGPMNLAIWDRSDFELTETSHILPI